MIQNQNESINSLEWSLKNKCVDDGKEMIQMINNRYNLLLLQMSFDVNTECTNF